MPNTVSNEQQATDFFARWSVSYDDMCESFEEIFAPDCRWDQRPMIATTGPASAIRFLNFSRRYLGLETIDVEILRIAATGDVVICERVDHLRRSNGKLIASAAVTGVMEFRDGKLVYWREYFDLTMFARDALTRRFLGLVSRLRSALQ